MSWEKIQDLRPFIPEGKDFGGSYLIVPRLKRMSRIYSYKDSVGFCLQEREQPEKWVPEIKGWKLGCI